MIVGNLSKENLQIEFVTLDEKELKELELDISEIKTKEKLQKKIEKLNIKENKL